MEIKRVLLNSTINKLHARAAVALADVTEYVCMQTIHSLQKSVLLLGHFQKGHPIVICPFIAFQFYQFNYLFVYSKYSDMCELMHTVYVHSFILCFPLIHCCN